MKTLENGMIEITIKRVVDKIYVKNEKGAIQIAMRLRCFMGSWVDEKTRDNFPGFIIQ